MRKNYTIFAFIVLLQVFGGVACLSSHLSMSHVGHGSDKRHWQDALLNYLAARLPYAGSHRIYMDHGTEGIDAEYVIPQQRVDSLFTARGWDTDHYMSRVYTGHDHNESDWSRRLHVPLLFLLRSPVTTRK